MIRKWIYILIALAVMVFIGYRYVYQDHRNIAEEEAEFVITAQELTQNFENNASQSQTDYLNKTIVITGSITDIGEKSILVDNRVFCQFGNLPEGLKLHSVVKIKGRCIGFDDLLGQAKLDQCSIIQ